MQPPDSKTTILTVASTLQAMADAEFAMWLERQSSAVRAMTEAEQIEIWADPPTQCAGGLQAMTQTAGDWRPIWTAPCTDTFVMLRYKDGREFLTDLDHDSDPDWWAERGATEWRYPTDAEYEGTSDAG